MLSIKDFPAEQHAQIAVLLDQYRSKYTGLYTVKEGDTLSEIGEFFGASVEALASVNQIADPDLILIDMVLFVPREGEPQGRFIRRILGHV